MTTSQLRARRSCLAVPGSSQKFIDKARTLPADQVFLDLEDACAPLAKPGARKTIVNGGEIIQSEGSNSSEIQVTNKGTFVMSGATLNLTGRTAGAGINCTIFYENGATVSGGSFTGQGVHEIDVATLSGTTFLADAAVNVIDTSTFLSVSAIGRTRPSIAVCLASKCSAASF